MVSNVNLCPSIIDFCFQMSDRRGQESGECLADDPFEGQTVVRFQEPFHGRLLDIAGSDRGEQRWRTNAFTVL
jgi:hypothetical protein